MSLPKRYDPKLAEPRLQTFWQETGVYDFDPASEAAVYAIDTPPPTVSGNLHMGHVYSYSHPDMMARFWRMNGRNVFYPMGYDDNGLPTERLVERRLGVTALEVGRQAFIEQCLELSEELEADYQALWQRLGLSVDWRYLYRTIDDASRRTSQLSFIELYGKGLAYHQDAPAIWCPECRTAIAQAELNDLTRASEFVTLAFHLADGTPLPIATTRPELLPACVAVFVHPDDERFRDVVGRRVRVPLFGHEVPVLRDRMADPDKGTGTVMCCTFGDTTDVEWWRSHDLPLRVAIERDGTLTEVAGQFAGLPVPAARRQIIVALEEHGFVLGRQPITQSVRVHERCDTPVEYIVTRQWFIRVLPYQQELLDAGEQIVWRPAHMQARYREWVENLRWDWGISRQRYFGVPLPVWYCAACGETHVAGEAELPIDPTRTQPATPCACGSTSFVPEQDVMDTWATSSLSPQIAGRRLAEPELYQQVFPMTLRAQGHDIIRTWAFYTIVKSNHHFGTVPWNEVLISGWGLAPEGTGKISKSRGGGPAAPMEMIERYSADALRYWAASTGPGKDAIISEEKMQAGVRLANKLWSVANFSQRFLQDFQTPAGRPVLSVADRWILAGLQRLIHQTTEYFRGYDYAAAKNEVEQFFWRDVADNYLEMAKRRLYDPLNEGHAAARYTLHQVLLTMLKLFAPIVPYITEEIYQGLFATSEGSGSIHNTVWSSVDDTLVEDHAERAGNALVNIATAVRRYKSEHSLPMSAELQALHITLEDSLLERMLAEAEDDLRSVTRAHRVVIGGSPGPDLEMVSAGGGMSVALA